MESNEVSLIVMSAKRKVKKVVNSNVSVKGGDIINRTIPEPVILKPLQVTVGDNFEKAFKAFRAIVQKDGVLSKFKEKQSYEKPSMRKRRKRNESRKQLLEDKSVRDKNRDKE